MHTQTPYRSGQRLCHQMSSFSDPDIIERMMSVDPDEEFRQICMCIRQGDVNKARRLYRCADMNQSLSVWDKRPPMHLAIQQANTGMVRFLLDNCGANPNASDDKGRTALHMAVLEGNEEIIRLLVDHGRTEFKAVDKWGQTALHLASLCSNTSAAKLLLDHCIECLHFRQRDGYTPLQIATMADNKQIAALFSSTLDNSIELNGSYRHALAEMNGAGLADLPTPPSLHSPYIPTDTETLRAQSDDNTSLAGAQVDSTVSEQAQDIESDLSRPDDLDNSASCSGSQPSTVNDLADIAAISVESSKPIIMSSASIANGFKSCKLIVTATSASCTFSDAVLVDNSIELPCSDALESDALTSEIPESPCVADEPNTDTVSSDLQSSTVDGIAAPITSDKLGCPVLEDRSEHEMSSNDSQSSVDTSAEPTSSDKSENLKPANGFENELLSCDFQSSIPVLLAAPSAIDEPQNQKLATESKNECFSSDSHLFTGPESEDSTSADKSENITLATAPAVTFVENDCSPGSIDSNVNLGELDRIIGTKQSSCEKSNAYVPADIDDRVALHLHNTQPSSPQLSKNCSLVETVVDSDSSIAHFSVVPSLHRKCSLSLTTDVTSLKPINDRQFSLSGNATSNPVSSLQQHPSPNRDQQSDAVPVPNGERQFDGPQMPTKMLMSLKDVPYDERSRTFTLSRTLLKLIAIMSESAEITMIQKGTLKDLVVKQDPTILAAADLFEKDRDLDELKDTLVRLCRCR